MNAPVSADSVMTAGSLSFEISVFKTMPSNGSPDYLAVTCMIAVRNDIGLNMPDIHREHGGFISSQYSSN